MKKYFTILTMLFVSSAINPCGIEEDNLKSSPLPQIALESLSAENEKKELSEHEKKVIESQENPKKQFSEHEKKETDDPKSARKENIVMKKTFSQKSKKYTPYFDHYMTNGHLNLPQNNGHRY
ncbi:hypothetical protein Q7M73_04330 [Candidatus Liberibacter asiaticus]|uniref:hypothetical protein n=1 Tax=Liberibacter asiaticus TaxID=34021 RepID=UPI000450E3A7|nr:hypothetical protein [Candidatus Liberibacter asiaticus]ALK07516.1 hypothetical protein CD16_04310 [Candidatus Liberibacter asiaticus]WCM57206.1 hypothetical protein NKF51_04315 [Candidatus Liberibacter asiaticus]